MFLAETPTWVSRHDTSFSRYSDAQSWGLKFFSSQLLIWGIGVLSSEQAVLGPERGLSGWEGQSRCCPWSWNEFLPQPPAVDSASLLDPWSCPCPPFPSIYACSWLTFFSFFTFSCLSDNFRCPRMSQINLLQSKCIYKGVAKDVSFIIFGDELKILRPLLRHLWHLICTKAWNAVMDDLGFAFTEKFMTSSLLGVWPWVKIFNRSKPELPAT